jgi:hypothetical protein
MPLKPPATGEVTQASSEDGRDGGAEPGHDGLVIAV